MWFWIWLVLIIGGLGVLALVVWKVLWRAISGTWHAFDDAGAKISAATGRDGTAYVPSEPRPVVALGDIDTALAHVQQRRDARQVARLRRRKRHEERWQSWLHFNE